MKDFIKKFLENRGWFLRKQKGLNIGVDFFYDLKNRFNINPQHIFDVGAHKGETIQSFIKYYPNSKYTAFEPIKNNFEVLSQNFGQANNIVLENIALSNIESELEIELQNDSQTNSLRYLSTGHNKKTEIIRATTLDNYVRNKHIENIDFLKIDVEGFEKQVIEGALNCIDQRKITSILLECSLDPRDNIHSSLMNLQQILYLKNYELTAIYDQVLWDCPKRLAYFNAFFLLK